MELLIPALRDPRRRPPPRLVGWLACTFGISGVFGRLAVHNLANYRPLSNDEGELMAVGYKLATQGVMGSDMYVGFFGGDQHYFETLPVQHILEAISFRLLGAGVAQARLVSVLAAVSIVWLVGWLAFRWYGLATAVVCEVLLTLWPSNLTDASDGLPLLGVARTARYDVLAVCFAWLAIALLDATLRNPRPGRGFVLGVCSGLAALTQFFGVFVLPLVGVGWLWTRRRAWFDRTLGSIVAGAAVVLLSYGVYVGRYSNDLVGQLGVYGSSRGDFLDPWFFISNVLLEPSRFSHLLAVDALTPFSAWALAVGAPPAVALIAWRTCTGRALGDRLLLVSLVTFGGLLALLDQTKTPLYAIMLLPPVCLAMAVAATSLVGYVRSRATVPLVGGLSLAGLAVVGLVGAEALRAFQADWLLAAEVTPYLGTGQQIDAFLSPGTLVLGPERWWWALHEHPYISLRSIWFQWVAVARDGSTPNFVDWVRHFQPESVVVNINVRGDIEAFPQPLQAQFWAFINDCTIQTADLPNPNYFDAEVYQVIRPAPDGCGGDSYT